MEGFIAVLLLLVIASIVHVVAKHLKLPYTILLFLVGMALIPVARMPFFSFLNTLYLTPDLLFYIFLPVLIFESGYTIKYQELSKNHITIWTLAVVGLLLAATIIAYLWGWVLALIGFVIPISVMFLFGIIIASTDPVAVLSIFKDLWVSRRLTLLFEWESLFNDGTAVAVFFILLEIFNSNILTQDTFFWWFITFLFMVIGGIGLGIFLWLLFSKAIKYIKNNEAVEITLTIVLAHITFIIADLISKHLFIGGFNIEISWVIATAYAAIIMGNYGKTKISPRVEEYMDKFWNFFAFISNAIVFLLMGLILKDIAIPSNDLYIIIPIAIAVVIIARAISIYIPIKILNKFHIHEHIPSSWQHLLARGSLRWALALMLALLIPVDLVVDGWMMSYSIREFVIVLVIACVMFSLIIKGLTIEKLLKKLWLDQLHDLEVFEKIESEIMIYTTIIEKIEILNVDYHISKHNYDLLRNKYEAKREESQLKMQLFLQQHMDAHKLLKQAIDLHALGIEKEYLKEMFRYNEVDELLYFYLLNKIETQVERLEKWESQFRKDKKQWQRDPRWERGILQRIINRFQYRKHTIHDYYIIYRTRYIITNKVITGLKKLKDIPFGYPDGYVDYAIVLYTKLNNKARESVEQLKRDYPDLVPSINACLLNKWLMKTEEKIIKDLYKKEMITHKLYSSFMQEIEEEILRVV
jgi:CPA1 family monovalent cation:H+ antiporter